MELLQEFKEGDVFEDQMVVPASQVESSMMTTFTKTAIIKKTPSTNAQPTTFTNCSFGNIGTLNIHTHKN